MNDAKKCAVLVPVASTIEPETHDCLSRLIEAGYAVRTLRGCSQVDLARSIMASQALRDGFTETLWIDSDVVFSVRDVERIRQASKPMVAGLYVKKGKPEFAAKFTARPGKLVFGTAGGLIPMVYVGMGFTLIRSEVYRAIAETCKLPQCGGTYDGKPVTPFFIPAIVPEGSGHCYLSEDFAFCHRAAQAGFKIFADSRLKLGHVGRKVRTWDDLAEQPSFENLEMEVSVA